MALKRTLKIFFYFSSFCLLFVGFWIFFLFPGVEQSLRYKGPSFEPGCQPIMADQCGDSWQTSYCNSHYQSLQSPNTANVLSYHCKEPSCSSGGNQIQGIVSLFYLALLTNRTFIISGFGSELKYLEPNRINWSLPLEMFGNFSKSFWGCCNRPEGNDSIRLEPKESFHDWITTKDIKTSLKQLEAIGTNLSFSEHFWLNPFIKDRAKQLKIPTSPSLMVHCAGHFLFKKSDALTKALDEARLGLPSVGTQQSSSMCQPLMTQQCGHSWQTAYCSFHRLSLQSPKKAKVLAYDCAGNNCGGLGNQFQGLLSVFWLALLTNRTFVINWHQPGELREYLEPSRINWNVPLSRFGGTFHKTFWSCCESTSAYHSSKLQSKGEFQNWIPKADLESLLHPLESIGTIWQFPGFLRSNTFLKERAEKLGIPPTAWRMLGCAFHFLFKKTNAMEKALDEARRSISRKPPLLGIHLRTSDHHFGVNDPTSYRSRNVTKFFICAMRLNNLIRKINTTTRNLTWFLAVDDKALKRMAKTSFALYIITLNLEPKHSAYAGSSGAIFRDVFLDIFLLSESRYLIITPKSSFSRLAAAIGHFNGSNTVDGEHCLVNETIFLKTISRVLG